MSQNISKLVLFEYQDVIGYNLVVSEVTIRVSPHHYSQKHYEITAGETVLHTVGSAEDLLKIIAKVRIPYHPVKHRE